MYGNNIFLDFGEKSMKRKPREEIEHFTGRFKISSHHDKFSIAYEYMKKYTKL